LVTGGAGFMVPSLCEANTKKWQQGTCLGQIFATGENGKYCTFKDPIQKF